MTMIAHPVADMLTRIRNANAIFHPEVSMPHSKMKESIARILQAEGYINSYEVIPHDLQPELVLKLQYQGERSHAKRVITTIRLVSKPSRRVYVTKDAIPQPLGGMGVCILSTSQGVLSGHEAKERGTGGEVLCEVF
ncbi:MAG: 30S ribosomal protein S8 [Candidatus Bipolaricaulota bacterium]|nr:30S ribosomal protein S8 [Candidatus Bipolaricaulota bacterium]